MVTEENRLFETDLSGQPSLFRMSSLRLIQLIFIFYCWKIFHVNTDGLFFFLGGGVNFYVEIMSMLEDGRTATTDGRTPARWIYYKVTL